MILFFYNLALLAALVAGAPWWLDTKELNHQAEQEQAARLQETVGIRSDELRAAAGAAIVRPRTRPATTPRIRQPQRREPRGHEAIRRSPLPPRA